MLRGGGLPEGRDLPLDAVETEIFQLQIEHCRHEGPWRSGPTIVRHGLILTG